MATSDFPITTHIVWDNSTPIETQGYDSVMSKVAELFAAGKTNNFSIRTVESNTLVFQRKWADTDTANTWIQHVTSIGGNRIISATIS